MERKLINIDEANKFILNLNDYTDNHKYEHMAYEDEDFNYEEYLNYINKEGEKYIKNKFNIDVKLNLYDDGNLEIKYNKKDEHIIDKLCIRKNHIDKNIIIDKAAILY